MIDLARKFDVLVVGGGNAAMCAAITARRAGATVLILEAAPKFYRGGAQPRPRLVPKQECEPSFQRAPRELCVGPKL